jgi:hypothetical protein
LLLILISSCEQLEALLAAVHAASMLVEVSGPTLGRERRHHRQHVVGDSLNGITDALRRVAISSGFTPRTKKPQLLPPVLKHIIRSFGKIRVGATAL